MPNNFITTRTTGSHTSTYGLADHIAESDPHPQYLLKADYASDGIVTDSRLQAHMSDPTAHTEFLATIQMLSAYVLKSEFPNILSQNLYHDYASDSDTTHAASMSAVNGAYGATLNALREHTKFYAQDAAETGHRDDQNQELYAHRVHTHGFTDLSGVAAANHNHDDRYSLLNHRHDDRYAQLVHYHNELYSPISHTHDERYALKVHNHNELYSLISHTHNEYVTNATLSGVDARVNALERNAIMCARHDFISSQWQLNGSTQLYEYSFRTNHFTTSHIYMLETGGSVLVDESVEVHIVGSTEFGDIDRQIKLVAPQAFSGYIITLG